MKSLFVKSKIKYDGSQLHSLYSYLEHKVLGDSILSWVGPCDVTFDHMVDGEDLLQKASIKAESMLHFIIEVFDLNLFSGVCMQRLFAEKLISYIRHQSKNKELASQLVRCGDDIYCGDGKLNISIATVSPSSVMIHFAVNVDGIGAPVKVVSLNEFGLEPKETALALMELFVQEFEHMKRATQKVKWVK